MRIALSETTQAPFSLRLPRRASAVKIALWYTAAGALWILGSGWVLHQVVRDHELRAGVELVKGWAYVGVTALLLGMALDRYFRVIRDSARLLQESEERWKHALEGASQAVWDWNPQTDEVLYSPQWKAMLGFGSEEMGNTRTEWERRIHPHDLSRMRLEMEHHLDRRTPAYASEHRVRCKDGSYRWILDRGKVTSRASGGEPLRVVGTHSDITQRKVAEEALRESRRRLGLFFNQSLDGYYFSELDEPQEWNDQPDKDKVLDYIAAHQRITEVNDAMLAQYGARREEFLGRCVGRFFEHETETGRRLRRRLCDEGRLHVETCERKLDGSLIWIEGDYVCLYDDQGRITGSFGMQRDITERKQAERVRQIEHDLLQALAATDRLEDGLRLCVAAVIQADGLTCGGCYLADPESGALDLCVHQGLSPEFVRVAAHVEAGSSLGRLTAAGQAVYLELDDLALGLSEAERREGLHAVAVLPLRHQGRVLGCLNVASHTHGTIPASARLVLETIAAGAAQVIARLHAQEALRESERNFQTFFQTIDDLIVVATREGRIVFGNAALERKLGFTVEELRESPVVSLHPPDVRAEAGEILAAMFRGERQTCPLPLARKDGGLLPVETRIWAGHWGGQPCLFGVSKDLSAEREAEQRFERLFRRNPLPMALSAVPERRFVDVNEAWLQTMGYERSEVIGRTAGDLDLFRVPQESSEAGAELLERGSISGIGLQVRTKDGRIRDGLFSGEVVLSQGKRYFLTVMSDITEQKQTEEMLRQRLELQDQLAKVATTVPGLICSFKLRPDGSSCMPFATPAITELYGLQPEDVAEDFSPVFALVHPDDRERLQRSIAESGRTMEPWHDIFRARHPQKGEIWVEGHSVPRREPDGSVLWHGFVQDVTGRRRLEQEREAALIKYRTLFDTLPLGITVSDPQGRVVESNRLAEQLLGISTEEHLQRHIGGPEWRIVRPDGSPMPPEEYASVRALREQRLVRDIEMGLVKSPTETTWITVTAAPVPLSDVGVVITYSDITERKRLEAFRQALLSLGHQLNSTRDAADAGRALLEAAGVLWRWDAATLDLLTASEGRFESVLNVDTIAGRRCEVPVSGRDSLTVRVQRVTQRGGELILREEANGIPADAVPFGDTARPSASIMSVPFRREAQVIGVLSLHSYTPRAYADEDLKVLQALADYCGGALDRIRSEEAHHRAEERYRNLVETSFEWIWELDAEGRYSYASTKVKDLLGYAAEEVLGRTPFELMAEGEADRLRRVFGDLMARRSAFSSLEKVNLHKDGREVVLESSGVPVLGPGGEWLGYRGIDRDITERKQLESQLRQAQKLEAVGQLAGGVAHDFNNILAAMMMHLGLLQMNAALDAETQQALKEMDAQTRRAAALTRQLLMFSRRSVLAVRPLDLNEVVANLLKMLSRLIGEQIELRFDGMAGLPPVGADAGMLEQVLMNLVVNARDAMPKGGCITIRTRCEDLGGRDIRLNPSRRSGRFVSLAVADTGTGMEEATLKRIFEPFFTTKEAGKGTGLGLATVHGIVAQHRGWVEVESAPGQGTTFRVFLPSMVEATEPVAPVAPREQLLRGRETVLLVEDDAKVRRSVCQALQALGYRVYEAANGQDAVRLWQEVGVQVQLLLTDMVMPEGMTGLELVESLQALKPGLKAIISSGYSAEIVQAGVPSEKGIVYLPKPYATKTLAEIVRQCLDDPS